MVKIILEKNYFIDLNSLKKTYTWNNVILKYNKVYESNIN